MTIPSIFAEGEPLQAGFVNVFLTGDDVPTQWLVGPYYRRWQAERARGYYGRVEYRIRVTPWIVHDIRPSPVNPSTLVRVRLRSGEILGPDRAGRLFWRYNRYWGNYLSTPRPDIVAWQPWPQDR